MGKHDDKDIGTLATSGRLDLEDIFSELSFALEAVKYLRDKFIEPTEVGEAEIAAAGPILQLYVD